jgi:putative metallohydrolase (TIGR04338 family)
VSDTASVQPAWAERAEQLMIARAVSRAEAAGALGISVRSLTDRLEGRVRPLTSELERLAGLLGELPARLLSPPDVAVRSPLIATLPDEDLKVYRAGAALRGEPSLVTVVATQRFVEATLSSTWWKTHCPDITAVVVRGCGHAGANSPAWHTWAPGPAGGAHTVNLPRWARRPSIVLHELAHAAVAPLQLRAPHGRMFARAWVELVAEHVGADKALVLRRALRDEGVGLAPLGELDRARQRAAAALARLFGH